MFDLKEHLNAQLREIAEEEKMFPNRHIEIHKDYCKACPSNHNALRGEEDPESKELKESCSKEHLAHEYLFVCAWRPNKLCKGLCDYMEIDENFLQQHKESINKLFHK